MESNELAEAVAQDAQEPQDADLATAEQPADEPAEEPAPKGRYQKRIDELVGQRNAVTEDRDYWRSQALELQRQKPEPVKDDPPPPQKPKLADFDHDVEAYAEALSDWTDQRIVAAVESKAEEVQKQAAESARTQHSENVQAERQRVFAERSQEFAADHPDYFALVGNPTLPITSQMSDVIMEMENGPEIVYHLAQHPEQAHRIAQQSGAQVAISLATLKVEKPSKPEGTKAPEPPKPITGGKEGVKETDPRDPKSDKMSADDWFKARIKQKRGA